MTTLMEYKLEKLHLEFLHYSNFDSNLLANIW